MSDEYSGKGHLKDMWKELSSGGVLLFPELQLEPT